MMAEKARLFADETTRAKILSTRNPATIKKLGRQVRNFDHHVRMSICVEARGHAGLFELASARVVFIFLSREFFAKRPPSPTTVAHRCGRRAARILFLPGTLQSFRRTLQCTKN